MTLSGAQPREISGFVELAGESDGAITVGAESSLRVSGVHTGRVDVSGTGELHVSGELRGALTVDSLATATITGDVVGAIEVRVAGTVVVEATGRVAGPVTNYGSFTNRGLRSGPVEGRIPDDQPGSIDVPPVREGGPYVLTLPPRA